MADYISRDEIFSVWRSMPKPASIASLTDAINQTPAADVEPVRHGRWIESHLLYYGAKQYECSLCWAEAFWDKHRITEKYPCCPNCGSKMDLEDKNNDD